MIILAPLAVWTYPVYLPPNATATVYAYLPPSLCNATGVFNIDRPITVACVNTGVTPVQLSGRIAVEYHLPPPPPQTPPPGPPIVALVVAVAAAAGLSHLVSNRRELLTAPFLPIIARVKRAGATDDPARREILQAVDRMGAATLSQIVKAVGKSWGAVQWHVYVLEREGKLKSIKIGPFTYYFVDRRKAADVILSSIDPSALPLEDKEKLDFLASA